MVRDLARMLDACGGLRVLVLGEAMLDAYLRGTARRLSPEAPVPVVAVESRDEAPGGAANAAANVVALGGRASLLSVVGTDVAGVALRDDLMARGVDVESLQLDPERQTLTKRRLLAGAHMIARFDEGSTDRVGIEIERRMLSRLEELWHDHDAVLVSDYDYGVITPEIISRVAALQRRSPRTLVVDSKRLDAFRAAEPTAVKPNYEQALQLLGGTVASTCASRAAAIAESGDAMLDRTGARIAAVTLDYEGAVIVERGHPAHRTHSRPARHSAIAGAGDTFAATLALALAAGSKTTDAADLAAAAAAIVVSKEGTATCSARELRDYFEPDAAVWDVSALEAEVERVRANGRRVVFTNGCFDVLHSGHVDYLARARALGDLLIVGLNSDDGVRRLKGPGRPVNTLRDRARVLAALGCVDHVVAFDEDTPIPLIRRLRPDICVKGGDYSLAQLPEAPIVEELGGEMRILPYVLGRSTTDTLQRIREADSESLVG